MRPLAIKLTLISLPALFMIAFNYWTDPARLFHPGLAEEMGILLAKGNDVTGLVDYDERTVQQSYIEHLAAPNDTIVLGSSRAMQIRSDDFPGVRFFNNAVSGAAIQDLIAIYGIYERERLEPRTVVLGIDPWTLNAENGEMRWLTLRNDYERMRSTLGLPPEVSRTAPARWWAWEQISPLVSPDYFQAARRSLSKAPAARPVATHRTTMPNAAITRHDGWHIHPASLIDETPEGVRRGAQSFAATRPMLFLDHLSGVSPQVVDLLGRFIDWLRARHVTVKIVLTPYHPIVYSVFARDPYYAPVLEAERDLRALASRKGLELFGSYDPAACGCTEDEFFDGMHPRPACVDRIMRREGR